MKRFTAWYLRQLDTRPILTKSISSAFLVGLGDLLTQTLEMNNHPNQQQYLSEANNHHQPPIHHHHHHQYDYVRVLKMASYGLFVIGPTLHLWYKVLDKYVAKKFATGYIPTNRDKTMNAIRQMVVDQSLFAPFSLVQFLTYMGLVEGKTFQSVLDKLKVDMWPTLVVNWYIWPAAQMINFTLIPLQYRVLFVNSIAILWNAYLSHVQHKD